MKKLLVNKGEKHYLFSDDERDCLCSENLGNNIAITAYNPETEIVGLAILDNKVEIIGFIEELIKDIKINTGILEVRLVGGISENKHSEEILDMIVSCLEELDNERDIINIVSADVLEKEHPESFMIDKYGILLSTTK